MLETLGEGLLKSWKFRLFTAEEETLILSEPVRVRVSGRTLGKLIEEVGAKKRT